MSVTRTEWETGIFDDPDLSTGATLMALLLARFWPDEGKPLTLWCPVAMLMHRSKMSRTSVYKFLGELRDKGWLVVVEEAQHNRAPRYRPALPKRSATRTPASRTNEGCATRTYTDQGMRETDQSVREANGSVRVAYPTPEAHERTPEEPSPEKRKVLHSRSACTWCGGGGCPQCDPDEYSDLTA